MIKFAQFFTMELERALNLRPGFYFVFDTKFQTEFVYVPSSRSLRGRILLLLRFVLDISFLRIRFRLKLGQFIYNALYDYL
ncbi:hypothetical protein ASF33_02100 [Methylobacterium sp. Leaf92]|nr:hypothetical protein ASF33_02100 [Methylobacterium sp. Leaf92]